MDPIRLSLSKVKTYDSCHKKFKYNYILKLPRKDYDFYTFGKLLHKTLEKFHLDYLNGSQLPLNETMIKAFKIAKNEYKEKLNPLMINECVQLLQQYLKILRTNKNHPLAMPITAVEKNFELSLNDTITLVGAIDRTQIDQDGVLHIADYKTSKNKKYLANDPFQLMTYALVLMLENPSLQVVRTSYILARHHFDYLTWTFQREEIMKVKDKYIEYAKQITEETEYVANPTKLCQYCEFLDHCIDGQKAINRINGEVEW